MIIEGTLYYINPEKIKIGDKSAISITLFADEAYVFINPKVFYAGNHHREIIDMAKFRCPEKTK